MNTIPQIATVAQLQRNYRPLVTKVKKSGKPLFVLSNGKPDIVIMDIKTFENREERLQATEEEYLLSLVAEAKEESNQKKTIIAKPNETLLDILDSGAI